MSNASAVQCVQNISSVTRRIQYQQCEENNYRETVWACVFNLSVASPDEIENTYDTFRDFFDDKN